MVRLMTVNQFFGMLFANIHRWSDSDVKYERGAWVRVFGVPVHAWNIEFFKLCVLGAGRFLHVDECTEAKARLDFARILISTSQLEKVNSSTACFITVVNMILNWWRSGAVAWGRMLFCRMRSQMLRLNCYHNLMLKKVSRRFKGSGSWMIWLRTYVRSGVNMTEKRTRSRCLVFHHRSLRYTKMTGQMHYCRHLNRSSSISSHFLHHPRPILPSVISNSNKVEIAFQQVLFHGV